MGIQNNIKALTLVSLLCFLLKIFKSHPNVLEQMIPAQKEKLKKLAKEWNRGIEDGDYDDLLQDQKEATLLIFKELSTMIKGPLET